MISILWFVVAFLQMSVFFYTNNLDWLILSNTSLILANILRAGGND